MAIQIINVGTNPNDGTGDLNRTAWQKGNANFADLDARTNAAQSSATSAGAAAAAAQSSATSAGSAAAAAQTTANSANTNANSRILASARDAAGGVANINALKRLPYALETALRANTGNYGRSLVNPDGLFYTNNATGAFVIRMTNTTAMTSMRVRIYNYGGTTAFGLVEFVAMLYATGSAIPVKYLSHLGTLKVPVRFAMETATNRRVMIIGDVGTVWGFPSINIMDAVSHRTGILPGAEPYDCDLVTNLDAYSQVTTVDDTGPYASADAASQSATAANANAETRMLKTDRGATNGVAPLVSGFVPVANIPVLTADKVPTIPVSKVTGAAPTAAPAFTGVATFDQLKTTGVTDIAASVSIGGAATFKGSVTFQQTVTGLTAAMVGLGSVNNTADSAKPVSTAQQTALNAKANLAGGASFSGSLVSTGPLTARTEFNLQYATDPGVTTSPPFFLHSPNGYRPHIRGNSAAGGRVEFVNAAASAYTLLIRDNGIVEAILGLEVNTANGGAPKGRFKGFGANQNEGISLEAGVSGSAFPIVFRNAGAVVVGSVNTNDSSTLYNTTSDYRLKNEIGPVVSARDRIKSLRVFIGEYKTTPGSLRTMMFAHEIQDYFPHAVTGRKDAVRADGSIEPQQVDYSALVPDIVAGQLEEMMLSDQLRTTVLRLQARQQQQDELLAALAARIKLLEAR